MQFESGRKPPLGIVYDSDFGATIDSILALGMLHGLDAKSETRIAGLCIGSSSLEAAQLCDVIEKFYSSAVTGPAAAFFQGLPVGLASGKQRERSPLVTAVLAKKDEGGKQVFVPRVHKLNDTAVPEVLIRNALSAQYDGNAAIVLAGPATNLIRLLDLPGSKDLIASKVKVLVLGGSAYRSDAGAAKRLLAEWPTPIIESGDDLGAAIPFPGASIEKDFAYSTAHPVAEAYKAYRPMPYDAPAPAMAAVLFVARTKENYFGLSEAGKHRKLVIDPTQKERIVKAYVELASAKPAPRSFRRQQAVAVDEQADPAKVK